MSKTILTCAVTGAGAYTEKSRHVPVSPEQIAGECIAAARAGAAVCHIHVRDSSGAPSMEAALYREVAERIRASDTDLVINLTTGAGARYIPDKDDPLTPAAGSTLTTPEVRVRHVVELKPEICSLDIGTMNFGRHAVLNTPAHVAAMAEMVQAVGTKPELEVFDVGHIDHARRMVGEGIIAGNPFFQICLGVAGGAPATPEALIALKSFLPPDAHWGGFGVSAASLPMVALCVLLGGHVRVGLEDNLYLRRGELAPGNAALVEQAVDIVSKLGGQLATAAEAREILELKKAEGVAGALCN
ncbi:3-keto-5-aminohexanoate cleavage protein [Sphingomonas canadensis]|uniref:3-keto-5-aminohexanoate cleavage protein n=1 Tax=Sphingomonas canadensis TaxID=1219257 RepID=A0ABW3H4F2_9SPHN|nr:3-keto-5-aminohexanoate cleavage protein [Sphingomonas canadensis]MCW3834525.1 3-keto-5-aminohexanoate cleavage protein [Sphingomonas canadensis]